ncbi:MAG TPA: exonuclease subunit SbcD [Candidatus Baltobacteraceae bacterium]|nr:exonuclease subunit SbcD [Candidatus Baltobacteraceae bacterium]
MRALHTSDWHIGVNHHKLDRTPDHDHVFSQLKRIAIEEKVDFILNTGDLFDSPYPSLEVLRYGWSVLEELASVVPGGVVVLCGNHDGAKLFELMGTILKDRLKIFFVDPTSLRKREGSIVQIPTADGEIVKIGAVPFIKSASYIRDYLASGAERATVTYADEVGSLEYYVGEWLNGGYDPTRDIRIFAAHLLLDGAEVSGSEYRLYVERDFVTRPERIPVADYVAFGHIHKPQYIVGLDNGRYAGSPIPIDFGEREDRKLAYLISGKPGYALKIEERYLDIGRRLIEIRGDLPTIRTNREAYAGAVAKVYVELDAPISELETQVREILQDTTVCTVVGQYRRAQGEMITIGERVEREPTLPEMFATYLDSASSIGDPKRVLRYFDHLLGQVQQGGDSENAFPEIDEVVR